MKYEKFAIRHIPTQKWVKIVYGISWEGYIHLMEHFNQDAVYSDKTELETSLAYSYWGDGRTGRVNTSEFEIIPISVKYTILK